MSTDLVGWRILGVHRADPADGDDRVDGVDLAIEFADGTERALGLRTPELFLADAVEWDDAYVPFPTDLDPAAVGYWSFDRILWLGPEPQPCVVWTNAVAIGPAGVDWLLRSSKVGALLSGRDGAGLPLLADVVVARSS